MRIGILSFPGSPSHGASLQMYALYQTLVNCGVEAEIINYIPDKVNHKNKKSIRDEIIGNIADVFLKSSSKAFLAFEKQMKKNPAIPINTTKELVEVTRNMDRIIVGSDQVWNPIVTGNDMNYYLEFCQNDDQKASYAPSFGVDNVNEADRERITKLLSCIKYLCVRESRGQEIVKELTGRDVPVVVDPTLLLDGSYWRRVKKTSGAKGKYVFVYTIKPSPKLSKIAHDFADKHGLNYVFIDGGLHGIINKFNPNVHSVSGIGPAEFIDLIDGAEYIFTNSFHGTAFSINLNKNFFVEFSTDSNSRLKNIIETFGMEESIIDCDSFDYTPIKIDYERVNSIINEVRDTSMDYLERIIN